MYGVVGVVIILNRISRSLKDPSFSDYSWHHKHDHYLQNPNPLDPKFKRASKVVGPFKERIIIHIIPQASPRLYSHLDKHQTVSARLGGFPS